MLDHLPVLTRELDRQLALAGNAEIGRLVLIAEGVAADDDGVCPARDDPRDVADDNRLTEDDTAKDIADRSHWRFPHFLEAEFLDALLVRSDRRALHADTIFLDGSAPRR
jgi:hypothetical protein